MKKFLFILISFFAWGMSTYAQNFIQGLEITLYKDIKKTIIQTKKMSPKRAVSFLSLRMPTYVIK